MSTAITKRIPHFTLCESSGKYKARRALSEQQILKAAESIATRRIRKGEVLAGADLVRAFLLAKLGGLQHECLIALFLDTQHRLIEVRELFRGTIDCSAVYPREVVRACIELNAAAVIFAHNHPSGTCDPSAADRDITRKLIAALGLIDVRVLDHFIVGDGWPYSFAECGLIDAQKQQV